jgi:hypothetical protein
MITLFLALKWIWRIFENCLKVELSLSTTLIIHWIKTKLKFLICSNCRDKEDWHRPDLFRPTVQMWLTQAAAESGRLRVQPAAVRVRRLLLHLMKDLYHQLRLLTSPVSLYCHSSFSAQQITSSTYRHLKKIVPAPNHPSTKMFCVNLIDEMLFFKIPPRLTLFPLTA